MTSLALLALPLLLASPPADDRALGVAAEVPTVDEGHFIGTAERVFLDWGSASRVLRARAAKEASAAAHAPSTNPESPAEAVSVGETHAERPSVYTSTKPKKKRALDSLSNLARIFAGGLAKAPSPMTVTPLPHFEQRDDDAARVGDPLP